MLGKIRKFSSTIFAKIFLFLVAIPFIFWGMGDIFSSGNKNTVAKIDNDKIRITELPIGTWTMNYTTFLEGLIDGTTIATSDITVGSGKTLDLRNGTLTLDDNQINGSKITDSSIAMSKTAFIDGINCTLTGNTLNIDDVFLKNNENDSTSGVITAAGYKLNKRHTKKLVV